MAHHIITLEDGCLNVYDPYWGSVYYALIDERVYVSQNYLHQRNVPFAELLNYYYQCLRICVREKMCPTLYRVIRVTVGMENKAKGKIDLPIFKGRHFKHINIIPGFDRSTYLPREIIKYDTTPGTIEYIYTFKPRKRGMIVRGDETLLYDDCTEHDQSNPIWLGKHFNLPMFMPQSKW